MKLKSSLAVFLFLLFSLSCSRKHDLTQDLVNNKENEKISEICGLKIRQTHNVFISKKDGIARADVSSCPASFILNNADSEQAKTCSIEIIGPCVSAERIFSRYGDKDRGRLRKKAKGKHNVELTYTIAGRSYGVVSIETVVKAEGNPYEFKEGSMDFKLSGLAILRKEKDTPLLRSIAPGGKIKIVNSSNEAQSFSLFLENLSDSISKMEQSGLESFVSKKTAELSYEISASIKAKSSALIDIIPRKPSEAWCFAFGGDVKEELSVFLQLLEQLLLKETPLFILEAGDYTRNSLPWELQEFFQRTKWLSIPAYFVKGNHEVRTQGNTHYKRLFGPEHYSFKFDGVLFVILDSTDYAENGRETGFRIGDNQFKWLEQILEKNHDAKYTIIALHTPPNPLHGPSLRPSYPSNMMPSEAAKLMALAKKYNVTYVLSGHAHLYARKKIDGTIYLTSGAGGAKLHTYNKLDGFELDTRKHLMVFEVTSTGIKERRIFLPRSPISKTEKPHYEKD